jgi:hypothetical protein
MDILFNSPQHDAASVVDLYNALILWGTAAASKTPLNLTTRFCIQKMLPLLHFKKLTYQQFAQLASKDTVLTEREKVSIFMRFPQFQKQ